MKPSSVPALASAFDSFPLAITRNFPDGSQVDDRTDLVLSDSKDNRDVSLTCTIFTSRSLDLHQRPPQKSGNIRDSLHTATRSPCLSKLTHRIGTPEDRVMNPSNSFPGYEKTREILSSEAVTRLELCSNISLLNRPPRPQQRGWRLDTFK